MGYVSNQFYYLDSKNRFGDDFVFGLITFFRLFVHFKEIEVILVPQFVRHMRGHLIFSLGTTATSRLAGGQVDWVVVT